MQKIRATSVDRLITEALAIEAESESRTISTMVSGHEGRVTLQHERSQSAASALGDGVVL